MNDKETRLVSDGLEDIKRILVLIAARLGASQPEIAKALGISDRHLRRMLSRGGVSENDR